MSTASSTYTDHLQRLRGSLAELERRRRRRPLDFSRRFMWQDVAWALAGSGDWQSTWGAPPSVAPREILIVCANQVGKTTLGAMVVAAHATGRLPRWSRRGKLWTGAPSLAESVDVQRESLGEWLGRSEIKSWTHRQDKRSEGTLTTKAGWTVVNKSYDQGAEKWSGARLQGVHLDEPPPDGIVREARARLLREEGYLLLTMTPLGGIQSDLYESLYVPFNEQLNAQQRDSPPCPACGGPDTDAAWLEAAAGRWVITAGMRANAASRGGFLPDDRIDAYEHQLLDEGRKLEAEVRIHGRWLDVSEDRIIPVDALREWTVEPAAGFREITAWIDPAYSARTASCESCIAVAGKDAEGRVYLLEYRHGRWPSDERNRTCLEVLARHGDPITHVQRVPGDREFAAQLNAELMRLGRRACVQLWPREGPVPDKVSRANTFAAMVAVGQVHAHPEHVAFRRQASVFSASYLKAGGACDVLDAAMGALTECAESSDSDLVRFCIEAMAETHDDDWLEPESDHRVPAFDASLFDPD